MDYDTSCPNNTADDNLDTTLFECAEIYGFKDMDHAFLVARCSASWNESVIESQCTAKSNSMHVYDVHGVNYYNIFCAICNFIHPGQINIMGLQSGCAKTMHRGEQIRQCRKFEECPDSFHNETITEACRSYLYPLKCDAMSLKYFTSTTFRNPYCRICQKKQTNEEMQECTLHVHDADSGSQAFQSIWKFRPDVVKFETPETLSCAIGEVLDPVNEVCRSIVCSYGYVLKDDKCILKQGNYNSSDILNYGHCESYDAMIIFRGSIWSIMCLQKEINGQSELHPKQFEQAASNDPFDQYTVLLYEHVHDIVNFIEIVQDLLESNVCKASELEVLVYCIENTTFDCNGKWYALSPSELHPVDIPNYKLVFIQEGKYVLPDQFMVLLNFGSRGNINDKLEIVFFCGNEIDLLSIDCEMITFGPDEYLVNKSGLILKELPGVIPNDSYLLSSQSARVCIDSIPRKSQETATKHSFFYGGLDVVSFGFTCLSLVAELATFTIYCTSKEALNVYDKGVASLCIALFLAQVFTVIADKASLAPFICTTVAAVTHYTWLTAFTWTSILAVILADTFAFRPMVRVSHGTAKCLQYQLVGWLSPILIVSATTVVHFYTSDGIYGGQSLCWITNRMVNIFAFGVPVALVISNNMILVVITLVTLGSRRRESNRLQNKKATANGWKEASIFFKVRLIEKLIEKFPIKK